MRRFHGRCAATYPPSESVADELRQHGVPRVGVWPRGVDRLLFRPEARSEAWRATVLGAAVTGTGGSSSPSFLRRYLVPLVPYSTPARDEVAVVLFVARLRWEKGKCRM